MEALLVNILIVLLTIMLIDKYTSGITRSRLKIVTYAMFLSYYILSGNGIDPKGGIIGSLITVVVLMSISYLCPDNLYVLKGLWYAFMWLYAYYYFGYDAMVIPGILTIGVLVIVNTCKPWTINWSYFGDQRERVRDLFYISE